MRIFLCLVILRRRNSLCLYHYFRHKKDDDDDERKHKIIRHLKIVRNLFTTTHRVRAP